jgi:hypothetical protein
MQKQIQVQVSEKFGVEGLLPGFPAGTKEIWQCNVLTTLLWIGILTAPPRYRGFDLSTFWAWLRYASAISDHHSGLRLKPIWTEIDAHQKTVMSDDFGMGFSCHYLAEQHGIQAFANTNYLLDALVGVTTLRPSRRGPAKSPDFVGIDATGGLHILECKGTQSSIDYLWTAIENGTSQKNNFTNSTPFVSCMVGGIFVPQHRSEEEALLLYVDPKPDRRLAKMAEMPHERIAAAIYRISLAKELMAAGLWRTATDIEGRGRPAPQRTGLGIDAELAFAGFVRDGRNWQQKKEYRSIETDVVAPESGEQSKEYAWRTSLQVEVSDEVVEFAREMHSLDSNGMYETADMSIANRVRDRRQKRTVRIHSHSTDETVFRVQTRRVESPWNEQVLSSTSAALTGPSGIRFILTREEG